MRSAVRASNLKLPQGEDKPTKRTKFDTTSDADPVSDTQISDVAPDTLHSHAEIWQWTLTKDAIAPCRIEDIFSLRECDDGKGDPNFFWLGHVPCRNVLFYGVVVGVQVYEQRVVYTVDDGSGKIDCNLRSSPSHSGQALNTSKHQARAKSNTPASSIMMTIPTPPTVLAAVGDVVRTVGRVLKRYESMLVNLDSLTLCRNATEEPRHWLNVIELHETWYDAEHTRPFVIPTRAVTRDTETSHLVTASCNDEVSQPADAKASELTSPTKSSVQSSAPTTPSSIASSSVTSQHSSMSPPRLRHPSRLHTRDLTANTFRIYLKHYMDNAPADLSRMTSLQNQSESETSEDESAWTGRAPGTPTKTRGETQYIDMTPRPPRLVRVNETPKPRGRRTDLTAPPEAHGLRGFTLSHLRRVPELAVLARRVVEAESKRRAKEERKKEAEEARSKSQSDAKAKPPPKPHTSSARSKESGASSAIKSTSVALGKSNKGEPVYAKMKRLFRYAIRQLYSEGSIVLWDGPIWPLPVPRTLIPQPLFSASYSKELTLSSKPETNRLWKMSSSTGNSSHSSSISSVSVSVDDEFGVLSDPSPEEESYVPLTSSYLSKVVEDTIGDIMARPHVKLHRSKGNGPPPGPTAREIAECLQRRDERWAHVGEWAVQEALEYGREQGRLWCIGNGRWEVCG